MKKRCDWCGSDPLYVDYHDHEWGVPVYDNQQLFEFLILEGMQAGLSWITILRKREAFRQAFKDFDVNKIARFTAKDQQRLLQNENIIRNRLKISATIGNAQAFLDLQAQQDFSGFLWDFVDGEPRQNRWRSMSKVPAKTPQAEHMSKALKQRGFKFVGPTICYAFMQAVGMVNDHLVSCYRHGELFS